MNLTAIKDEDEVMERHIDHSLVIIETITSSYLVHYGDACETLSIVDIGCAGGSWDWF